MSAKAGDDTWSLCRRFGNGNLNVTSETTCKPVVSPSQNCFPRTGCFFFRNFLTPLSGIIVDRLAMAVREQELEFQHRDLARVCQSVVKICSSRTLSWTVVGRHRAISLNKTDFPFPASINNFLTEWNFCPLIHILAGVLSGLRY